VSYHSRRTCHHYPLPAVPCQPSTHLLHLSPLQPYCRTRGVVSVRCGDSSAFTLPSSCCSPSSSSVGLVYPGGLFVGKLDSEISLCIVCRRVTLVPQLCPRLCPLDGAEYFGVCEFPPCCLPESSRILSSSRPYRGGGANVPVIGASPHFLTLASIKTKPAWPKLMWMEQGPVAPTVGNRLAVLKVGWIVSSYFLPLRVKKTVPVRGR
jgi:hypothetical protein